MSGRVIETTEELAAAPRGIVVYSADGTLAGRFDAEKGVVLGSARTFPWMILDLPCRVLIDPDHPDDLVDDASFDPVAGYCPMGCGPTLVRTPEGQVVCQAAGCPRAGAVTEVLDDPETEHVVEVYPGGFTIRHPLRERLYDDVGGVRVDGLTRCGLPRYLRLIAGALHTDGRYRVHVDPSDASWVSATWTRIPDPTPSPAREVAP